MKWKMTIATLKLKIHLNTFKRRRNSETETEREIGTSSAEASKHKQDQDTCYRAFWPAKQFSMLNNTIIIVAMCKSNNN